MASIFKVKQWSATNGDNQGRYYAMWKLKIAKTKVLDWNHQKKYTKTKEGESFYYVHCEGIYRLADQNYQLSKWSLGKITPQNSFLTTSTTPLVLPLTPLGNPYMSIFEFGWGNVNLHTKATAGNWQGWHGCNILLVCSSCFRPPSTYHRRNSLGTFCMMCSFCCQWRRLVLFSFDRDLAKKYSSHSLYTAVFQSHSQTPCSHMCGSVGWHMTEFVKFTRET